MKINKIMVVGHSLPSSLTPAIIAGLRTLGFEVEFFDHFRPNLSTKTIGLVKNKLANDSTWFETRLNELINDSLYKTAIKINPDLVLIFKGRNISFNTIKRLRNKGYKVINWYPDFYDDWSWIKTNAPYFDFFITPCLYVKNELNKMRVKAIYLPFAAAADESYIRQQKIYNATFVGRFTSRRDKLFKPLLRTGQLDVWGYPHWRDSEYRPVYHGLVSPQKRTSIIRKSRIIVNTLTATDDVPIISVNYRVFEATGVGGFILSWYNYPLEEFFIPGREIETFKTADEALDKTVFYISHEAAREKIAKSGWLRTRKDHTYIVRLKKLIKLIK